MRHSKAVWSLTTALSMTVLLITHAICSDDGHGSDATCECPVFYSDGGIIGGSEVYTWSGADWGGPDSFFDGQHPCENAPEGTECFKACSGADWNGHENYAGWGIFMAVPSDHTIDLSEYHCLCFWVSTLYNLEVEIQEDGPSGSKYSVWISDHGWDGTDTWQVIDIPASAFDGVDLSRIFGPFSITVIGGERCFLVDSVKWCTSCDECPVEATTWATIKALYM